MKLLCKLGIALFLGFCGQLRAEILIYPTYGTDNIYINTGSGNLEQPDSYPYNYSLSDSVFREDVGQTVSASSSLSVDFTDSVLTVIGSVSATNYANSSFTMDTRFELDGDYDITWTYSSIGKTNVASFYWAMTTPEDGFITLDESGSFTQTYHEGSSFTIQLAAAPGAGEPEQSASIHLTAQFTPTAVPEPSTYVLVGLGIITLIVSRRIRKRHLLSL